MTKQFDQKYYNSLDRRDRASYDMEFKRITEEDYYAILDCIERDEAINGNR